MSHIVLVPSQHLMFFPSLFFLFSLSRYAYMSPHVSMHAQVLMCGGTMYVWHMCSYIHGSQQLTSSSTPSILSILGFFIYVFVVSH